MDFRFRRFILVCSLAISGAALGETPPDASSTPQQFEEELVVTGSRVPRKDLTSPAPVVIYSREEIAASGVATLGDFLQLIPWSGGGVNSKFNTGSDGTTQVSLRNLGPRHTLVLVDGKRWVNGGLGAGSGYVPAFDLNTISTAVIERVEVLKDGASAVYGSDAVAGVVNIITRRRMNGVNVEGYAGASPHGDAFQGQLNGTAGISGDRGGFLLSLGAFRQSSMLAANRQWAERALSYNFPAGRIDPSGSSIIPAGRAHVDPAKCPTQLCQRLNAAYPGAGAVDWIADGNPAMGEPVVTDPATGLSWRKYIDSGPVNDRYNFQAVNYFITPNDRLSLFANGDYRLVDFATARLQAAWVDSRSAYQAAPEPFQTIFARTPIDPTSPYNPFGVPIANAAKRLLETGPRQRESDAQTIQLNGGLDGTIERTDWSLSFGYGRTSSSSHGLGSLQTTTLGAGIGPAFQDASGVWRCGTPAAPVANCTPVNLFGVGSVTPAMAQSLGAYTALNDGWSQLGVVNADLSRDLFTIAADRPAGIALGYQFRREYGGVQPDAIAVAAHSLDFVGQPTKGSFNTNEAYAELVLPVVSGVPFADDVELQAAGRVFHYSSYGTNFTYKLGARWRPVRGFTLRGTWSTAFKAPTLDDLYLGQFNTVELATDPCSRIPASNAALRAQCAAGPGGASAVNNGDTSFVLPSIFGGNPDLQPETATSATAGAVIEPPQVKSLSITADYYRIKLNDAIARNIGTANVLAACYPASTGSSAPPDPRQCGLITRDPSTGMIQNVLDIAQNAGSVLTSGVDLALRYALPTTAGRFRLLFDGTYLIKQDLVLPNGKKVQGAGNYDVSSFFQTLGVTPRVRFNTGVDYDRGAFSGGVRARYTGGFDECAPPSGTSATGAGLCADQNKDPTTGVPYPAHHVSYNMTFDLYAAYALGSSIGATSFSAGVRNVFDSNPPRVFNSFLTYADPSYDFVGRYVWGRIVQKF